MRDGRTHRGGGGGCGQEGGRIHGRYMKSLPAEEVADPYANIPVFQTPTSDVLAKQEI